MAKTTLFWFRRDLRLFDNAGLYKALKSSNHVLPVFIFDKHILDKLDDKKDARVAFIHETLAALKEELRAVGSDLLVYYGLPEKVWPKILKQYQVDEVFTNRDYEPYALQRDAKIKELLAKKAIPFHTFKDQVIFEKDEILKADETPYVVFTPYSRKWKAKLATKNCVGKNIKGSYYFQAYPTEAYHHNFQKSDELAFPTLPKMGFAPSDIEIPGTAVAQKIIRKYEEQRNFPGIKGTSQLGIHFRFGTVSIREKARKAEKLSAIYLSELIWRDFYSQILAHFPHVDGASFRAKYDLIEWRNNEKEFEAWCSGNTGYPIVDAGMRELNATGFMHNRVRMITASFLTKHLLIDWRWGEAYFALKLLDFDLASNNGGWQWAAGSGTDAAPYFRIFNPYTQTDKFDKDRVYIDKWIPELNTSDYPDAIVDHKLARERCLRVYKEGLSRAEIAAP